MRLSRDDELHKDLSRFGRDYVEMGSYIEKIFPRLNIRFIAVSDNVDTLKNGDDILVPIKNVESVDLIIHR